MPCRSDYPTEDYYNSRLRAELDEVTNMLCGVLRNYDTVLTLSPETRKWWKAHQEADRRREAAEAKRREADRKKAAALKKLTAEERKILGLK